MEVRIKETVAASVYVIYVANSFHRPTSFIAILKTMMTRTALRAVVRVPFAVNFTRPLNCATVAPSR